MQNLLHTLHLTDLLNKISLILIFILVTGSRGVTFSEEVSVVGSDKRGSFLGLSPNIDPAILLRWTEIGKKGMKVIAFHYWV